MQLLVQHMMHLIPILLFPSSISSRKKLPPWPRLMKKKLQRMKRPPLPPPQLLPPKIRRRRRVSTGASTTWYLHSKTGVESTRVSTLLRQDTISKIFPLGGYEGLHGPSLPFSPLTSYMWLDMHMMVHLRIVLG